MFSLRLMLVRLFELYRFAEDVVGEPFERLFVTRRAGHDITDGGDYLLHTHLAVIGLQLRQFLESENDGHLVASRSSNQTVNLVEIERRHLVHTDVNGDVLALTTVHSRHQTVQDHGVQGTHNLFLLRVVGNE